MTRLRIPKLVLAGLNQLACRRRVGHAKASGKDVFEEMDDADLLEQANARLGREFDHIDVALR